ncbi:hypothetical protein T492DRAFT_834868 [Pavlovales sp. CCMP2436]|nr:hypothetical protein T492DRAFT_834868 [Pavlovales sp. CCMP2436]
MDLLVPIEVNVVRGGTRVLVGSLGEGGAPGGGGADTTANETSSETTSPRSCQTANITATGGRRVLRAGEVLDLGTLTSASQVASINLLLLHEGVATARLIGCSLDIFGGRAGSDSTGVGAGTSDGGGGLALSFKTGAWLREGQAEDVGFVSARGAVQVTAF